MQKCAKLQALQRRLAWVLVWCVITLLGGVVLGCMALTQLREAFETDARITHRLLSQRVVQHDAVMATLALLQAPRDASESAQPEQRLASVYPQILEVHRRDPEALLPHASLQLADRQGNTPLQLARSRGYPEMVQMLEKAGAT